MNLDVKARRRFIKRCDPLQPLNPGDPLYVDLDAEPSTRGEQSCVDRLRETIRLQDESCQLFSGFPGTGKTTELHRLAGQLRGDSTDPTHVIFIDFAEFIDIYTPISISDIIRVIAYRVDRAATIAEGHDPEQHPGYLQRLWTFLSQTDVELQKIGFAAYGSSLMLEIKNNPSFRQRLSDAVSGRFQRFVDEAREFIQAAVARLLNAPKVRAERVVVIADGLEKLTPLREEDRDMLEGSVETVFLSHRKLLQLPCHTIYTFPLWLRFRTAELGTSYGREPLILPMVRIADRDGKAFTAGIEKLMEVIERRVEDLAPIFGSVPSKTLLPLIEASGGYPRDLLRLVRSLLLDAHQFPIGPDDAARVVRELARSYEDTVVGTYVDMLARVHLTHRLPNDDKEQLALFGFLFERWLILAYRNGDEWYDLHPLVLKAPRVQAQLEATRRDV